MNDLTKLLAICGTALALSMMTGCPDKGAETPGNAAVTPEANADHDADDHDHDDADHDDHDHEHGEEVSLGTTMVGDYEVECWQAHGEVVAGMESHLVMKLPFNDNGQTVVRAWIGTNDRLASMVGRGEYAPSHDDYDIHTDAPNPLPENAMWWIEIERPDGSKHVGSIKLL